jgi:peptide/nickel transport system substrate-binding protein
MPRIPGIFRRQWGGGRGGAMPTIKLTAAWSETSGEMERPMLRFVFLLTALLLAAAVPAGAVTRGGTLVFGRQVDCIYLDPVHTAQNADIWISLNIYDTLTEPTDDGKGVQPGLASSWQTSEDGKTVTFKLRPNLKFADGSPLTVEDVKWSLGRASTKETGGEFQFLLSAVAGVESQGDDTIIVHLTHPDPTILQALATFNAGIMPEKLVMAEPGATLDDKSKSFADHPVGSGPFTMKSWTRNSEMVLTRNPYYWKQGADGKSLPYLDNIRFVIIPDDATRILKLKAGEIDAAEFVPYSRVAELKADPKLNMVLFPAAQVNYFTTNDRPTLNDGTKNPLADLKVREALNYATDKEALIQVVTYGTGTPEQSYMPMSTPLSYGTGPLFPYDIKKAKQLLTEAGYANGFDVTCMVLAGSADDAAKVAALQQMWAPLGVHLKVEQIEAATRLARYNKADFQMRTSLWTNDINDPAEITSIFAYYPSRQNLRSGWDDPKIDALFLQSQEEIDPAKRAAEYKEIQQRYVAAAPIIFAFEVPYPVAMAKKVKDFVQIPLGNNIFVDTHLEP